MPTVSDDIGGDGQLTPESLLDSVEQGFIAWGWADVPILGCHSCRHRFGKLESVSGQGVAAR
ncbi:hypothetical protein COMA1_90082 [Candidatus Nitrospira nitrosa]|uniref:Uncharacterized protein n=1 Tax=Candidatus Nitrospira nitrosa TaxID=1742972 RepID=A0A0S4LT80_9BACT|nr:hypothetical protein COMA1_90082 [Candidatus Nitrospira nitrosa]